MRKTNIKITIFFLFGLLAGIFSAFSAYASEINSENVIRLANEERSKEGLKPLLENAKLSRAAESKARDMLKKDYFAHTSPDGVTPWHWFEKAGYDYKFAGENLAINFNSAEKQNESWMKSATHRKNILNANFTEIGVAVASGTVDGKKATITVQEFGHERKKAVMVAEVFVEKETAKVAGETIVKDQEAVSLKYEEEKIHFDESPVFEEKRLLTGIMSSVRSTDYLKLMKGSVAISIFTTLILLFSSFAHKLSRIGEAFLKIERRFFSRKIELDEVDVEEYRIKLRVFPMDMRKIRVIHLVHMKQRE